MSFGQTLRNAREAKGLTESQVASQTRILVQIISDMEKEDFHRIPAPIYGHGFVRLFAECVGLDPAPLIQEFMEILEGPRLPRLPQSRRPWPSLPLRHLSRFPKPRPWWRMRPLRQGKLPSPRFRRSLSRNRRPHPRRRRCQRQNQSPRQCLRQ